MVDKITARINSWQARNLSYVGRITLVKAVIAGLINFWTRVFMLPKEVINLVTRICSRYVWGSTQGSTKIPPVAWDTMCLPEKEGGVGLKQMEV